MLAGALSLLAQFSPKVFPGTFLNGTIFGEQRVEAFYQVFRRLIAEIAIVALVIIGTWLVVLLGAVPWLENFALLIEYVPLAPILVLALSARVRNRTPAALLRLTAILAIGGAFPLFVLNVGGYATSEWISDGSAEPLFRVAKDRFQSVNVLEINDVLFEQAKSMEEFTALYASYYRITAPAERHLAQFRYRREPYDLWGPRNPTPASEQQHAEDDFKSAFAREQPRFDSTALRHIREMLITQWKRDERSVPPLRSPNYKLQYWLTTLRERRPQSYAAVATYSKVASMVAWVKLTDQRLQIRVVSVVLLSVLISLAASHAIASLNRKFHPEFAPTNFRFFTTVTALSFFIGLIDLVVP
jgi:hypothetical protein